MKSGTDVGRLPRSLNQKEQREGHGMLLVCLALSACNAAHEVGGNGKGKAHNNTKP